MAREEAVQRANANRSTALDQPRLYLDEGHVGLLGHQIADERAVRLDPGGVPVSAAWLGNRLSMLQRQLPPPDRALHTDLKTTCRGTAAQPATNRGNYPVPKIL
ncbi:hypothetical protein GGQ88_003188 [Novosphingobium hassiacum]|uniref:Uncharacterized protein n=1 Tax=Novosphingobium hassiacum TaxID=173676 RepID=A0A7W5ZZE2_9SPHN|nr:hypothetical protein [Novosphingobium hassiacum]MBB3861898.1 hypothetical protein [Novosphingobium hassiacum]